MRYPGRYRRGFSSFLKQRARNIVLRERAGNTNTQNNYDRQAQRIRHPVHSRPPARVISGKSCVGVNGSPK